MRPRSPRSYSLLVAFAAALAFCLLGASPAPAQDNRSGQLRAVHGTVVDKNDDPAPGSVVYLLNAKTQSVKTYIADDKGGYHFIGLDSNTDYQLHAEQGNSISPVRTISSFDSRRDMDLTLKLSKTKSGS